MRQFRSTTALMVAVMVALGAGVAAQSGTGTNKPAPAPPPSVASPDYIIGANDVLFIGVVGEPAMSGDFTVRPDGKITMLQIDELQASGLKPDELKKKIKQELTRFFNDPVPEVFVGVKAINSRNVFVQGSVNKQGPIPLVMQSMTISQVITLAGGLQEFADKKHILVISGTLKTAKGEAVTWTVNYDDIMNGKNLTKNNIILQPGDTVIVR